VVLLNSGAVFLVGDRVKTLRQGIEMAAQVIDNGAALQKLDALVELSQRLGRELA
jgi:anthranilate phosphoribosyltransferase